nr:MAG TPA: hypothetical protein [Caudoviricetes sp.]
MLPIPFCKNTLCFKVPFHVIKRLYHLYNTIFS